MNDPTNYLDPLIDRISDGSMRREEFSELEERLLADPALRRRFRSRMRLEANLRSEFQTIPAEILPPMMQAPPHRRFLRWPVLAGIAAALAFGMFFAFFPPGSENPRFVATIVSQEGAAWSAGAMVGEGAELVPGTMKLERGMASLRFKSGAVADLEAPVTIELLDPMRCRLSRGKAIFEVPESAIGFVVETPNGYAVDHGTRFAVALREDREEIEFGVLSGRISVHHEKSESTADVKTGGMVRMTASGIDSQENADESSSVRVADSEVLRFPTNGRETSLVHGDLRDEFLDPQLLMVKKDLPFENEERLRPLLWSKDRRSLIAFNLEGFDRRPVNRVTLRLNMVPSGRGYAKLLPETTVIEVYGIRDVPELERWDTYGLKWADAPGSLGDTTEIDGSELSLLGTFEIERSQLQGPVAFESPELTRFVNGDSTGVVGFLLVSASMPQDQWSLVHAFASGQHAEAAGPSLEIRVK